jgi:hypothetical protein
MGSRDESAGLLLASYTSYDVMLVFFLSKTVAVEKCGDERLLPGMRRTELR